MDDWQRAGMHLAGQHHPRGLCGSVSRPVRTIKGRDPTAQTVIGGVVEPTPLRLEWLDRGLDHHQDTHSKTALAEVSSGLTIALF